MAADQIRKQTRIRQRFLTACDNSNAPPGATPTAMRRELVMK